MPSVSSSSRVIVEIMVGQGVNPNAKSTTPSMAAAEKGREDLAQFLLGLPAINLEARCEEGWTALLVASSKGHLIIVKLLLDRGADPEAVTLH